MIETYFEKCHRQKIWLQYQNDLNLRTTSNYQLFVYVTMMMMLCVDDNGFIRFFGLGVLFKFSYLVMMLIYNIDLGKLDDDDHHFF